MQRPKPTPPEDYTRLLTAGLVMTVLLVAATMFYWLGETTRLARAADEFTTDRVQRGRQVYTQQCVSCHGAQGEGGVGPALNDRKLLKNTLDSVFFSLIRSGIPNTQMPAWSVDFGGPLTDEDVRDVVAFMRAWEPTAPEIAPVVFVPDATRGALLFSNTCALCHGQDGSGGSAPRINDAERLISLDDDWYRGVIRNGRPAKGMPTWGTVLSPNQVEDLIALVNEWRKGAAVQPAFSIAQLLDAAAFSLEQNDPASARLQVERALSVAAGPGAEVLRNAKAQLEASDAAGALKTVSLLRQEWPIGDPTSGAAVYSQFCAPCHGVEGQGGIGVALNPNEFVGANLNAQLVEFLLAGRSGTAMAGFKTRLNDTQIADVIAFLRLWQPYIK
jgi:mono/diheme cytochrome c family protein